MKYQQLNRKQLKVKPLSERVNKVQIESDHVPLDAAPRPFSREGNNILLRSLKRIKEARTAEKSIMITFGAHAIKNGLAPVLISLMERGWVTHLATNGAGIIHDWEFAYQGESSENVQKYLQEGQFGIWHETGFYINLAIIVGAYEGLGYGESVGALIENEGLNIPSEAFLLEFISKSVNDTPSHAAAAADLLQTIRAEALDEGFLSVSHPYKKYSAQAAAYRLNVGFTGHPMIGHDIIYNHPTNHGAAIGRCAQTDYLRFAHQVSNLEGGVYLSIGSAVMSPMVFEKSLSMAQNLKLQVNQSIKNHYMLVVDLAESQWNWSEDGEPPMDNPAYYLRYCKTFSRMGGQMDYLCADNRDLLLHLSQGL